MVVFFDKEERDTIIRYHFQQYYQFHRESVEGMDQATLRESELRANTCLEAFLALFADQGEFSTSEDAAEFLDSASSSDDSAILDQLMEWAEDAVRAYCGDGCSTAIFDAATTAEMADHVEPFIKTKSVEDGEDKIRSCWPLVQVVR